MSFTPTDPIRSQRRSPADRSTWERRRRAAWIDYLRTTRGARGRAYHDLEQQAWEQLRRRLARNDELAGVNRDDRG